MKTDIKLLERNTVNAFFNVNFPIYIITKWVVLSGHFDIIVMKKAIK